MFSAIFQNIICCALLVGCATPQRMQSHSPRLSEREVIEIAERAARRHGYRLADYSAPKAHFEFAKKDGTWTVFFEGRVPMPGNHFLVWVHDRTRQATIMPGE
jgi:hypothetical protein